MNTNKSNEIAIAKTIAATLGVESSGSSPEMMVNNALRNARKNSMMLRGESIKIIMRMLELAKSVGIKYDEKLIKLPEVNEEIKGWKNAGSDIARMRKARGDEAKTVHLHRLKKDGSESGMHDARKSFSSQEDAQRHHDNSRKLNPKSDIRHNLYIDGKQVSTLKESAPRFIEKVRQAEKSASTGNHKTAKMHLDNARSFMYGAKSTDAGKMASAHASYTKMRAEYEDKIDETTDVKEPKVIVTNETGKKMNGKVQAVHGPVQQIKYRNGKTGYYHQHNVSKLEEEDCQDKPTKRTYSELMSAIKHSAGTGEATVDDSELPARLKNGYTLSPTGETHRKQLIKHLLDH
jgi:hypothetical protein